MKFTVLLSIYHKEKNEYFIDALNSVFNQSLMPSQVVLVCDGPLTNELYETIEKFSALHENFEIYKLEKNMGLHHALNFGLDFCKYELVARMDTDDIACHNRFEIQVNEFINDTNLALIGSDVEEFINNKEIITSIKHMPVTRNEIISFSKFRNPFNHPSVMFRKSVIERVGKYREMHYFEDYDLWLRVINTDLNFKNIPQSLTKMRTVPDLYKRRGGISYIPKIFRFRYTALREKNINLVEFFLSTFAQTIASLVPNFVRKFIYQKILRKKV